MILPYLGRNALEIGIGGGRVAIKTVSKLEKLYAVDIS
jgi:ubiquinone/menaquinone biosynthesis C-methylase UbiE